MVQDQKGIMRFYSNLNLEDKYCSVHIIDKTDNSIVSEFSSTIATGTIFLVSNLCKLE